MSNRNRRLAGQALLLLLAGCASVNPWAEKPQHYQEAQLAHPLEVPPDLSRPQTDSRYAVPVAPAPVAVAPAAPAVPPPPALEQSAGGAATAPAAEPAHAILTRASGGAGMLLLNEPMEQAWRRVGMALERAHVTVEDRNRSQGLYYVRGADPGHGWRFWQHRDVTAGQLWRVRLAPHGTFVEVTVLDDHGLPSDVPVAQQIIQQLYTQLK